MIVLPVDHVKITQFKYNHLLNVICSEWVGLLLMSIAVNVSI